MDQRTTPLPTVRYTDKDTGQDRYARPATGRSFMALVRALGAQGHTNAALVETVIWDGVHIEVH